MSAKAGRTGQSAQLVQGLTAPASKASNIVVTRSYKSDGSVMRQINFVQAAKRLAALPVKAPVAAEIAPAESATQDDSIAALRRYLETMNPLQSHSVKDACALMGISDKLYYLKTKKSPDNPHYDDALPKTFRPSDTGTMVRILERDIVIWLLKRLEARQGATQKVTGRSQSVAKSSAQGEGGAP